MHFLILAGNLPTRNHTTQYCTQQVSYSLLHGHEHEPNEAKPTELVTTLCRRRKKIAPQAYILALQAQIS